MAECERCVHYQRALEAQHVQFKEALSDAVATGDARLELLKRRYRQCRTVLKKYSKKMNYHLQHLPPLGGEDDEWPE